MAQDENSLKRVLPHSIEAEQSVIGSMILDRDAITVASEQISGDDFYSKQYGIVFDAMVELYNTGKEVDPVTLQAKLKEKEVSPEVSSLEYLKDILATVPTAANIKQYVQIVKEHSTSRKLIKTADEISQACYQGKDSIETIMDDSERKIFNITQNRSADDFVSIDKVVMNAMDRIETVYKAKGTVTGIETGFLDLDFMTAGFQRSDLIIIAARPSMGKTAFVLNIAQHMAFKRNMNVAIFSLEMSKESLVNRMFSLESRVDAQKIRTGRLSDGDWKALIESAGNIGKSGLIIDDTPSIPVSELRSKCRKYKIEHGLDIIIIDYLQLMSGSGKSESHQQEISEISRSLKAVARELDVPVVALSQLSRAVEGRPDKRPMLSDLRESGAIEQDADMVMFIYRDDYYNKDSEKKGIAEIIVAKQRNGPIGTVDLVWLPEFTKFANTERGSKH
ncbi:MAG: replicative DNA helicase [Lachnospiraceae bacterium]|nr:replicative DNA helicase [Lachnospiraceae bacterium]